MIKEELVEEEPIEEGKEDMADDHGRERQSTGRQSIVKGKGLSIGLLRFFFFFLMCVGFIAFIIIIIIFKYCADVENYRHCIGFGFI